MSVEILFEDNSLCVCVKPAGVLSEEGGMPELLRVQLGSPEIFCVHRLDRAVGGVMVYARTKAAAGKLSAAVAGREMVKEYLAVVQGVPESREGVLRDLLYHDKAKNKSYVVQRRRGGVREAELEYSVLETLGAGGDALSLLRIKLHTGRSHQIRVQFSSRGMPLVGDTRYGSKYRDRALALWSYRLSFIHPFSGKSMELSALPEGNIYNTFTCWGEIE